MASSTNTKNPPCQSQSQSSSPLLAAFLWAVVGHLDKYIIDKIAENREVGALTLFSALAGVPVVVVLWLVFGATLWDHEPRTLLVMTAAGFLYVLGVIPYLYAMSYGETSSVMPQMLMVPLFTLALGYALLGEALSLFAPHIAKEDNGLCLWFSAAHMTNLDGMRKHRNKISSCFDN